jgi:hypothetical protein
MPARRTPGEVSMSRLWFVPAVLAAGVAFACRRTEDRPPVTEQAPVVRDAAVAVIDGSPSRSPEYRSSLVEGRDRAARGDWAGAVTAFERARAAAPGDGVAESELGWALFRDGELARAEQITQASIGHASAPRLKAASLYNLGRIREAQADLASAADAYRTSLALRPSDTVRARLAALDKAVPASDDPLAPAPLQGPFADVGDMCEAQNQRSPDSLVTCDGTRSGLAAGPEAISSPPRPIDEVRLVAMTGALDDVTCLLALRTAAGWWIHDGIPCETTSSAGRDWAASLSLTADDSAAAVGSTRQRRGEPAARVPRIVARFLLSYAGRDEGDDADPRLHQCEEIAVICGVGPSGRPSCTPNLTVAWASTCAADPPSGSMAPAPPRWDRRSEPVLSAGRIVFPAAAGPGGRSPVELATGSHRLVFP